MIWANGVMMFENVYDLIYNLLNEIGLSIDSNGYVYDQDSGIHLEAQGKKIKASVRPDIPCYAGQGEVVFDPLNNTRQIHTLLGYAIDKEMATNPEFNCISHYITETPMDKPTSITLKMIDGSLLSTPFYNNRCLKFIGGIFLIYGYITDLSNFDTK